MEAGGWIRKNCVVPGPCMQTAPSIATDFKASIKVTLRLCPVVSPPTIYHRGLAHLCVFSLAPFHLQWNLAPTTPSCPIQASINFVLVHFSFCITSPAPFQSSLSPSSTAFPVFGQLGSELLAHSSHPTSIAQAVTHLLLRQWMLPCAFFSTLDVYLLTLTADSWL